MSFPRYEAYKDSGLHWLGEVPMHWRCAPIKAVATVNDDVLTEATPPDFKMQYVEISDVEFGRGILGATPVAFAEAPSRARRRVMDGDVIVSTVRTYLRAIARVVNPPGNMIVSTGFAVVRPRSLHSGFLGYLVESEYVISEVISRSVGISYPAINSSDLMCIKLPLPPSSEQRRIATFLDRETAKIDALVAEQQRLIALLKEKRQAVISHAVTKGLDPNAPMRDSGVEWLGDVAAHWGVVRNRTVFAERDERSESGDGELLSVSHLTGVTPRSEKVVNMIMAETLEGYKKCSAGDLVINTMWAWMGALGVARCEGVVSPSYNVYRVRDRSALNGDYYDLVCRTPNHVTAIKANSTGVWESRLRLYPDAFFDMKMPLPPYDEQREIVSWIEERTLRFDRLIAEAESAIALLQERRSALISAAVTGKIDVRGLIPQTAEAA